MSFLLFYGNYRGNNTELNGNNPMSRFIVYVLVNIILWVGCDNLSVPKRSQRIFYNTVQNTQIFNACLPVAWCPNSFAPFFLILPEKFTPNRIEPRVWSIFKSSCFVVDIYLGCSLFFHMRWSKILQGSHSSLGVIFISCKSSKFVATYLLWYNTFNCNWVVIRWQYTTHLHTNNT